MTSPHSAIDQMQSYADYVTSLRKLNNHAWITPIVEGKWSVREIVSHIMEWDAIFMARVIAKLLRHEQAEIPVPEYAQLQEVNSRAANRARTMSKEALLDEAWHNRSEFLSQLNKLSSSTFSTVLSSNSPLTLSQFLEKVIVSHDSHHMKQMRSYLSTQDVVAINEDPPASID